MNTINPLFKTRIQEYLKRQHFLNLIGFELELIEPGETAGTLILKEEHQQQTGLVHGGVTATLADVVAGFAAYTLVPETHHVVTAELNVNYLHPGMGHRLRAKGRVVKSGSMINFCESEVWCDNDGESLLIAKASAIMVTVLPLTQ